MSARACGARCLRVYTMASWSLQPEEVESGEFLPVAEILQRAQTAPYTPDGMYVLRRHLHLTD